MKAQRLAVATAALLVCGGLGMSGGFAQSAPRTAVPSGKPACTAAKSAAGVASGDHLDVQVDLASDPTSLSQVMKQSRQVIVGTVESQESVTLGDVPATESTVRVSRQLRGPRVPGVVTVVQFGNAGSTGNIAPVMPLGATVVLPLAGEISFRKGEGSGKYRLTGEKVYYEETAPQSFARCGATFRDAPDTMTVDEITAVAGAS